MTEAMLYWVRDVGIDGFRCDVAGFVPLDFWEEVRRQLDEVKPVFMLAEWEQRDLHARAFDATYGWAWKEAAHDIAQGKSDASRMTGFLQSHLSSWPGDAFRMVYTENHDQNAWEGTPREFYGEGLEAFMTLQFLMDAIPLVHNGQEAGNERRLAFFEKDPITWQGHPNAELLKKLIDLKTRNPALWNGNWGGRYVPIVTDQPGRVVSFARQKDGNEVLAFANLSPEMTRFTITDGPAEGLWQDAFTGEAYTLTFSDSIVLPAWGTFVLNRKPLPGG
jgi:glycosidase